MTSPDDRQKPSCRFHHTRGCDIGQARGLRPSCFGPGDSLVDVDPEYDDGLGGSQDRPSHDRRALPAVLSDSVLQNVPGAIGDIAQVTL